MLASSQNSNDLSNMRWFGVPVGALAGAAGAFLVGAVGFPVILLLIALAEGQWWGYEFKPEPIEFVWSVAVLFISGGFSWFTPGYAVMGGISGFLGVAVGLLSRRGEFGVLAGVISGMIIGPLVAARGSNNLGGMAIWFMFVGGVGGLLGALAGTVAFDRVSNAIKNRATNWMNSSAKG